MASARGIDLARRLAMKLVPSLPTHTIRVGDRKRAYREEKARELAESIKEIGLINPITVYANKDGYYDLLSGLHRFRALEMLGITTTSVMVASLPSMGHHDELIEIDENLKRAELTPLEEADHIRRRQEIWEELRGGTDKERHNKRASAAAAAKAAEKRGEKPKPQIAVLDEPPGEAAFVKEMVAVTGKSEDSIERAIRRGKVRGTAKLAGTPADKGVVLDALVEIDKPAQKKRAAAAAKKRKANNPRTPPEKAVVLVQEAQELEKEAEALATVTQAAIDEIAAAAAEVQKAVEEEKKEPVEKKGKVRAAKAGFDQVVEKVKLKKEPPSERKALLHSFGNTMRLIKEGLDALPDEHLKQALALQMKVLHYIQDNWPRNDKQ